MTLWLESYPGGMPAYDRSTDACFGAQHVAWFIGNGGIRPLNLKSYNPQVRDYGYWFGRHAWKAVATLTYDKEPSVEKATRQLEDYVNHIGREVGTKVGVLAAYERRTSGLHLAGGRLHWHLVMNAAVAPSRLVKAANRTWAHRIDGGRPDVKTYVPGTAATTYLFKHCFHLDVRSGGRQVAGEYFLFNTEAFPESPGPVDLHAERLEDGGVPEHLRQFDSGEFLVMRKPSEELLSPHPGIAKWVGIRQRRMKQIRDEKKRQSRSPQSGALSSYNQIVSSFPILRDQLKAQRRIRK